MDDYEDRLAALRERYRQRLRTEAEWLGALLENSGAAGIAPQLVGELGDRAHKLAGTAGIFGDEVLGNQARELERKLKRTNDPQARLSLLQNEGGKMLSEERSQQI